MSDQAWWDRAVAHHQRGELEQAATCYAHISPASPAYHTVLCNQAAIAIQQRRHAAAIPLLQQALARKPDYLGALTNLSDTLQYLGRLDEALPCLRQMAALNPNHSDTFLKLGTALLDLNRLDDACTNLRQALRLDPNNLAAYNVLGTTLMALGLIDEAEQNYRAALNLKPDAIHVLNNLGNALRRQGRLDDAEESYRKALIHKPDFVDALFNLGQTMMTLGRHKKAEVSFRKLLTLTPKDPKAHHHLGAALQELGRLPEAETCFRNTLALQPNHAKALFSLGTVLHQQQRLPEAEACLRAALRLQPELDAACTALGTLLNRLDRTEEAELWLRQAVTLAPEDPGTWINHGHVLMALGRMAEAEASYRAALLRQPDHAAATYGLALLLLLLGRLEEGWPGYEARWLHRDSTDAGRLPPCPLPQWRGEPVAPNTAIVVFSEQGYGDAIQFARYLPMLATRFARVTLVTPPSLLPLLRQSLSVDIVTELPADCGSWQWQCPLLSLPLAFNTTLATIPASIPYLGPDPIRAAFWAERLTRTAAGQRRIGLVWAGNRQLQDDAKRSIPAPLLLPLLPQPDTVWVCLQKGERSERHALATTPGANWCDWMEEVTDFADSAALISQLDLVIAVDTAVAHLAGALGKPVWLLNRTSSEWRWQWQQETSPWYPSMRLFNQRGPWPTVISAVQQALRE